MSDYITKKAVEITDIDYEQYGFLYNLSGQGKDTGNTNHDVGDDYEDTDTDRPLLDSLSHIGRTVSQGAPFVAVQMEKHGHTQEAQIPTDQPIVFCVALPSEEAPKAEDVIPVIVRPGYIFVLHRQTWHSASHGLDHDGAYFWMAGVYRNEPTVWTDIEGGPVQVTK